MQKPIRILIPKALTDLDEDMRLDMIELLKYAKRLPKTLDTVDMKNAESDIWESNGDPLLADAEDEFFMELSLQQAQNVADLMIALGLRHQLDEHLELEKGFEFPSIDELIKRSKQQRDKFLATIREKGKATAKALA